MPSAADRQAWLSEAQACVRCPELVASRTRVVAGAGDPDAEVVFVAEAPGREEDRRGEPLTGRAGELFDELLGGIGLTRDDVFVTYTILCRPPENRDPAPVELERCRDWLLAALEHVRPRLVCPLGHLPTRVLRGSGEPLLRVHGQVEVRDLGGRPMRVYPLFHPAAALYERASVELLRADMGRIPALLAQPPLEPQPPRGPASEPTRPEPPAEAPPGPPEPGDAQQLGLF